MTLMCSASTELRQTQQVPDDRSPREFEIRSLLCRDRIFFYRLLGNDFLGGRYGKLGL